MNLKNSRFEWMCRRSESAAGKFLRIFAQWCFIIFGLMTILLFWSIPFLIITVLFAVLWLVLLFQSRAEYEFDYLAGDLEIYKITNRARRKRKFFCTLDNIDYLRKGRDETTPTKKFFFHPDEVYTMQVNIPDGKAVLLIEADERFIQLLDQERKLRK